MKSKRSIIQRLLEECCLLGDERVQSVFEPFDYVVVAEAISKMLSFGFSKSTILLWLCSQIEVGNVE